VIIDKPPPLEPTSETIVIIFVAGAALGACLALLVEFFVCHA
jgi:uncharacterized protein involved in exopolysaccharide biosynthesis